MFHVCAIDMCIAFRGIDSDGTSSVTITLTITDVNDNPPQFSVPSANPTTVQIEDGKAVGCKYDVDIDKYIHVYI